MKNITRLQAVAVCVSTLAYSFAFSVVSLKELSADYVLDTILLKEQDKQKLQQTLNQLPEDIQDTIRERILARYKLQLFFTLSLN